MPRFLLHHRHGRSECAAVFAAWRGFDSPLSGEPAASTCPRGGHEIWWRVEAPSAEEALSRLPGYVARRTRALQVQDVEIP